MARSLAKLKHLEISKCQNMEEIVAENDCSEENKDMFCKLKHLQLQNLPNLTRFCSGHCIEFSSLELLHLEDCTQLGSFVFDSSENVTIGKETEKRDSKENLETDVPCFLLDEKVEVPSLETLIIHDLPKLMTIWHHQLAQNSFHKLRKVDILRCHNLINIFAPSMIGRLNALDNLKVYTCRSLQAVFELGGILDVKETHDASTTQFKTFEFPNLEFVEIDSCEILVNLFRPRVENCGVLEDIVVKEIVATPTFVFPKVVHVGLKELPQLRSLYPGLHVSKWPLLNYIGLLECGNVEIFGFEFTEFQKIHDESALCAPIKQPFFLIEKGNPFPNLEKLVLADGNTEIWYGPLPPEYFRKLKFIEFNGAHPQSFTFLEKLHNLERLSVCDGPWKEIFVYERNSNAVGTLPHVKNFRLNTMPELLHLDIGNDSSQPVTDGPLFPNLEILEVYGCRRLKNNILRSSLISFQNLTTLDVWVCIELEYLTTYSVAKCLQQLKKLQVEYCRNMIEIVASNGDDDDSEDEIAFSRLEHLKLSSLTSLRGFCSSGNCIVKVPSLTSLIVNDCHIELRISPDGLLLTEEKEEEEEEEEEREDDGKETDSKQERQQITEKEE